MVLEFPNIDPVAFSVGPLVIRWYALAYLAGFLLGWQYILYISGLDKDRKAYERTIHKTDIDDFFSWGILGVIVGGRCGYVLFYQPKLYWMDPWEIPQIWHGGMSFHGGMLGVIVAMVVFTLVRKMPLLRLADMLSCAVPIGLFFGRIANFINGELFGRTTEVPWGMVFPYGGEFARHPSQLYEAGLEGLLLAVILAVLVHIRGVRDRPGLLSGVFLCLYGMARIFIELFREPDLQIGFLMDYFTMGQVLSVPMVFGGLILIIHAFLSGRNLSAENAHDEA